MSGHPRHEQIAAMGADPNKEWDTLGGMLVDNAHIVHEIVALLPEPADHQDRIARLLAIRAWLGACRHPNPLFLEYRDPQGQAHYGLFVASSDDTVDENGVDQFTMEVVDCTVPDVDDGTLDQFEEMTMPERKLAILACQAGHGAAGKQWLDEVRKAEWEYHQSHPGLWVVRASARRQVPMPDHVDEFGNRAVRTEEVHWNASDAWFDLPLLARLPGSEPDLNAALLARAPTKLARLDWVREARITTTIHPATTPHRTQLEAQRLQNCTPGSISMQKGRRL